jgi:probable phosphoglycerate mutase
MPTILLCRHGETQWNHQKRVQGRADSMSPLTLKGIDQAKAMGVAIRRLIGGESDWRVVASPLSRCVQSVGIICETAGLPFEEVTFDLRLAEVDTGSFSGMLKSEMKARHPELMAGKGLQTWFFRCPGGECWDDMAARIGAWLGEQPADAKLVVVSHGVAGRVLRSLYSGLDPEVLLADETPQDALFVLAEGKETRVAC